MSDTNQQDQEEKKMSPQEIAAMHVKMTEYYTKQNKLLKLQRDYETYAADIEDARLRGMTARIRLSHLLAPPKPETPEPAPEGSKPETTPQPESSEPKPE